MILLKILKRILSVPFIILQYVFGVAYGLSFLLRKIAILYILITLKLMINSFQDKEFNSLIALLAPAVLMIMAKEIFKLLMYLCGGMVRVLRFDLPFFYDVNDKKDENNFDFKNVKVTGYSSLEELLKK